MARVNLANVHDHAQEVISAASSQLVSLLGILRPAPICIGQHVELKRELNRRVDLGSLVVTSLLVLESLFGGSASHHSKVVPYTVARKLTLS